MSKEHEQRLENAAYLRRVARDYLNLSRLMPHAASAFRAGAEHMNRAAEIIESKLNRNGQARVANNP